jgi:Fur family ferric uptake transcriptional regulator
MVKSSKPGGPDPGIGVFFDHLKAKGFKATPQRRSIAEAVFAWHGHFTAEELFLKVKKSEPLVGRMTVYRTLAHLVESGVVHELVFDKGVASFEHVFGHGHHDHLICTLCGKVLELRSQKLETVSQQESEAMGFKVVSHTIHVFGHCPRCQKRTERTATMA